jgi:hypothetical protein
MTTEERCPHRHPELGSQCQLPESHNREEGKAAHCFPIDDAFLDALDDGRIIVGRPPKKPSP